MNIKHADFIELSKKNSHLFSEYANHPDALDYSGCEYIYKNQKIIQRTAKITPKKIGQFVTSWKRDQDGQSVPYSIDDSIDHLIVICKKDNQIGLFIFSRDTLLSHNILTSNKEGKRGFRVYPSWDTPENKQAMKTQAWQNEHFQLNYSLDLE